MHCLFALQQLGFQFELKGGTSLSKAYQIIDRFSEDIDLHIHPHPDLNALIMKVIFGISIQIAIETKKEKITSVRNATAPLH